MILCYTQKVEAIFQRKRRLSSRLMNYYKTDGRNIVHHMPKCTQHVSDAA